MEQPIINVLLTSFPGLGLPPTLSLPLPATTTIAEYREQLHQRAPIDFSSTIPIADLLPGPEDEFLSLRLSAPLCGGKGGFGSQLRAAGGRMSSKRKKNQGENNGSSRNLDGRRLRTVTEAKALAEYLAIKPDMEKKEKEQRRKRWEKVVELAEQREEEIKSGSKGKVDGKWVEEKEEAGERTREAVLAAMRSGNYKDNLGNSPNHAAKLVTASGSSGSDDDDEVIAEASSKDTTPPSDLDSGKPHAKKFFGFDEEDEFMSDEDGIDESEEELEDVAKEPSPPPAPMASKGKGKGKAKAAPKAKIATNAARNWSSN